MPEREVSSFDRLMMRHAPAVLEVLRGRILGIVGGVYSWAGVLALLAGLLGPGAAIAVPGAILAGTGGFLFWLRGVIQRQGPSDYAAPVELTPEAKGLAYSLVRHLFGGDLGPRFNPPLRRGLWAEPDLLRLTGGRRSEDVLAPETFRLLDDAARACNRIHGVLSLSPPAGSTLQKIAPAVRAAVMETMADVLHTAALMEKTPEGAEVMGAEVQRCIRELEELAERVEQFHGEAEAAEVKGPTRLQALLEDLHAERSARAELTSALPEETLQVRAGS